MAGLSVALMGAPHVLVDGRSLQVDTRKAVALLAYLAVSGEAHRRDVLAALLWPEHDQEGARGALRRTLSTLKKALGGRWLLVDRAEVSLDLSETVLDVAEFNSLLAERSMHDHLPTEVCDRCLAPLRRATDLHRGDFMAGFSLRDSVEFEDWQYFQSEELRRRVASALELLVQGLARQAAWGEAITTAHRWLALDPLHEPAHRRLMLLYAWSGQRTSALKQYRECVALLDRELGVAPLEETVALYEAITENAAPPPDIAAPVPPQEEVLPKPSDYPLVGRTEEVRALVGGYEALGPDGAVLAVEGEAGIGKTRLLQDFADSLAQRGAPVAWARCHPEETDLAYGSVTELLRSLLTARPSPSWIKEVPSYWLGEAARLVPELNHIAGDVPPPPPLEGPGAQARFFEGLHRFLLAGCNHSPPGLLVVDDLHWADEASLDLLNYVCGRLEKRPLCLALTWRSEEVGPGHRVRRLVQGQRAGKFEHIELGWLGPADVSELAAGDDLDPTKVDRLYRETEGLPFFLVEYLAALRERADAGDADWATPAGVRELLQSRLSSVTETGWQVLTTCSVVGSSFDFDTVREVSGRGEEETVAAFEELIAARLVKEVAVGTPSRAPSYDFSHDRIRTLVYEQTSGARRRLLHRRVAESLSRAERRTGAQTSFVAHHYQLAGQEQVAAEYYERAGRRAASLYAHGEALAHFRSALALEHPRPWDLYEQIGAVLTLTGDYAQALLAYETAAALAPREVLPKIEHRLGNVHGRRGDYELASVHFGEALTALGTEDPARAARVHADWSVNAHRRGDRTEARTRGREALGLAERAGDERALAQAHNVVGLLARAEGDVEAALSAFSTSARLAESLSDPTAHIAALNNLALAHGDARDYDRAIEYATRALELCATQHDRHREAAIHNNLADLLHAAGKPDESMSHLKEAVRIFAEIGSNEPQPQPEIWKLVEW